MFLLSLSSGFKIADVFIVSFWERVKLWIRVKGRHRKSALVCGEAGGGVYIGWFIL